MGLIPKIVKTKHFLMSVAHAAFYCFRKMEVFLSEGKGSSLENNFFEDTGIGYAMPNI